VQEVGTELGLTAGERKVESRSQVSCNGREFEVVS